MPELGKNNGDIVAQAAQGSPDQPIVVEMGKASRKRLKELEKGEGKLAEAVRAAVEQVRATIGVDAHAELVPVVMVYSKSQMKKIYGVKGGIL